MQTANSSRASVFNTARAEKVFHNADANELLPKLLDNYEFERAVLICSRSLNTKTDVIDNLKAALRDRCVGVIDRIGEHSPLGNVIAAAEQVRDLQADVIIGIGSGSVMDLCKVVQLCISEDAYDRERLLQLQFEMKPDILDVRPATYSAAKIRQIYIPTTMATAEWTNASTPKDEYTGLKARYLVFDGGPLAIIYDPVIVAQTPSHLLLSTAIRGLDHAINNRCALEPHPVASALAEQAFKLFVENLPLIREDPGNREAMTNCQLATAFSGMGVMSVIHSFSHWVVHIVGPYADVSHSDAACVFMLAQARWIEGHAEVQHNALKSTIGRGDEPMYQILDELLTSLALPRTLRDLGITEDALDVLAEHTLQHPWATRFNLRPITTKDDVLAVMNLAMTN